MLHFGILCSFNVVGRAVVVSWLRMTHPLCLLSKVGWVTEGDPVNAAHDLCTRKWLFYS